MLPTQRKFFESFQDYKGVAYIGGVGSGKTITSCVRAMSVAMKYPRSRGMMTNVTIPQLEKTTIITFFKLFPEEFIGKYNEVKKTLFLKNGSIIYFWHTSDPDTLKGPSLLWFAMDEGAESPYMAFKHLRSRSRNDADTNFQESDFSYWVTSNAAGKNWIYDEFYCNRHPEHLGLIAPTSENIFNPTGFEASLRAMYTPEEAKRFLDASFDSFIGQIFTCFSRSQNVCDSFDIPKHWFRFRAIDFGLVHPFAVLWAAEDEVGTIHIYRELLRSGARIEEMAGQIKQLSGDETYRYTVADYAGKKEEQTSMTSPYQQLIEHGIPLSNAHKHDKNGTISLTNTLFHHRKIIIHACCEQLIEQVTQYQWEKSNLSGDLKPTPKKVNDDLVDCLLYIIAGRPDKGRKPEEKQKETAITRFERMKFAQRSSNAMMDHIT